VKVARVWLDGQYEAQHHAVPPKDGTAHEWEGATACGAEGRLRWVTPENVDAALTCPACAMADGYTPALEGDWPGPV
jgi:hypothetical protein